MNNLNKLPEDILNIIFFKLTPIEAYNLSKVSKIFYKIFHNLKQHNKYIRLDLNNFKKEITLGNRYLEINNHIYKIINIISYFPPSYNIIFYNGYILNVNENRINLFNYKKFNILICKEDVKLITNSKFKNKINSIKISKYSLFYQN
tara:strand:- start:76 stop:516 length:441 start_codon:yes stop_codon:yes gene_type:complete